MDVSIIIVNYNTKDLTKNCIESIKKYTQNINYEIILIDNASTDGSKDFFTVYHDILYLYSEENIGFGRANNLGVKYAGGTFLFFLNSDTILKDNAIGKMHDFFISHEKELNIGVLGSTLVDENGDPNGSGNFFPNVKSIITEKFGGLPIIRRFLKYRVFYPPVVEESFYKIDYVLGADMFLKKNLFLEVGQFNPEYFMYYEEAEIQYKIAEKHYKNYIIKDVEIIHLVAKSSATETKKASNFKRIVVNSSRIIYLRNIGKLSKYLIYEYLFMILIFFNFKYSWKENVEYCKNIIKNINKNVNLQGKS